MSNLLRLVLLYGGKSGEHEISLISAASVLANLNPERYHVIPVGMDHDGRCYINDYQTLLAYPDALPVHAPGAKPLDSLLVRGQLALDADVVFPVVHGPLYEDGCIQGVLELAGVPYVGCNVLSSAIGMDKDVARRVVCDEEIQTTRYRTFQWTRQHELLDVFCQETAAELGWPMFVKPCAMGSSVGIHKVNNVTELHAAIADARRYDDEILIEAFAEGREIELAVLENSVTTLPPKVSLPGEIVVHHPDGFYSYTAKYIDVAKSELQVPAQLSSQLTTRLQHMAAEIFTRLKCRGMARVDFFVDDKKERIYFNEINTIPGFTPISMYPKMWAASGLPYDQLLDQLIELAIARRQQRDQLVTQYQ